MSKETKKKWMDLWKTGYLALCLRSPSRTTQGADFSFLQFLKMEHAEEVECSLCRQLAHRWDLYSLWCHKGCSSTSNTRSVDWSVDQSGQNKGEVRHLIGPSSCLDENKSKAGWTCCNRPGRRSRAHCDNTEGWFQFITFFWKMGQAREFKDEILTGFRHR